MDSEKKTLICAKLVELTGIDVEKNEKEIVYIIEKYNKFTPRLFEYGQIPYLYDALSGGLQVGEYSSVKEFDENDVRLILKLFPSSVYFTNGYGRCRRNLTPLYIACMNENVSLSLLELLLLSGAPTTKILVEGSPTEVYSDVEYSREPFVKFLIQKHTKKELKSTNRDISCVDFLILSVLFNVVLILAIYLK